MLGANLRERGTRSVAPHSYFLRYYYYTAIELEVALPSTVSEERWMKGSQSRCNEEFRYQGTQGSPV